MPTYDYQCRVCGHTIEVIHPMSEDGPTSCEVCGGALRRVLYPAGIIFKGSGFYKTDSRRGSSSTQASGKNDGGSSETGAVAADAPASDGGDAKPSGSSETATPTAPPPKPAAESATKKSS